MKKQTGWLVRDPKGKDVEYAGATQWSTRDDAIWCALAASGDTVLSLKEWWAAARKRGYTVERVDL